MQPSDIARIADLARLAIAPAETDHYARELTQILDLVARMNAVDTTGVAPLAHPLELTQRLRLDEVTEVDRRAAFHAIAPATQAGLYLVPRVIE